MVTRRKGRPSSATRSELDLWHETLRRTVARARLALDPEPSGQLDLTGAPAPAAAPSWTDTERILRVGIMAARELGSELDPAPADAAAGVPIAGRPRARSRVDYGDA